MIELSVPACGYFGAMFANRQLMCCFCSCNLFISVVSIIAFIRLHVEISEANGECFNQQTAEQKKMCETWNSTGSEKYVKMISSILVICIGALAFWFGNALYRRLAWEFGHSGPPMRPLVGEVVVLSPSLADAAGVPQPPQQVSGASNDVARVLREWTAPQARQVDPRQPDE